MLLSYPPMTTKSSPASAQLRTLELCWLGLGLGQALAWLWLARLGDA